MPTTPSGCGIRRFLAGTNCSAVGTRCGAIHFFRCLAACLISPSTIMVSAITVSVCCDGRNRPRSPPRSGPRCPRPPPAAAAAGRAARSSVGAGSVRDSSNMAMKGVLQGALPRAFQWLVHGVSRSCFCGSKTPLLRAFMARRFRNLPQIGNGAFLRPNPRFCCHKILKKRVPRPFPKQGGVDTYRLAPDGFGPGCLLRKPPDGIDRRHLGVGRDRFGTGFSKAAQRFNAGWSSPVARQAHNLKVIGSNPIPATNYNAKPRPSRLGFSFWGNPSSRQRVIADGCRRERRPAMRLPAIGGHRNLFVVTLYRVGHNPFTTAHHTVASNSPRSGRDAA